MMDLFRKLFAKPEEEVITAMLSTTSTTFVLKIGDLLIGTLKFEEGEWTFQYSEDFKNQDKYNRLVGFSDLDKTYRRKTLWPFFKIRIPGLKQPMVQEILKEENIDQTDEASLLKRFGRKNISNPYILETM